MRLKILLSLLVFFLVACRSEEPAEPTLQLAGVNYLGDLPTLVASKNNLFQKHHLNLEVSLSESGKQNLDDLLAGKVDFALMAPTPFTLDKLANADTPRQGNEPVILGNLLHSTRMNQILTLKGRNIQTVNALKGGKVGLSKGTNAEYLWWLYTVFYQLDADSVELINLPVTELGSALVEGKVDAIVTWQPWTNRYIDEYADQIEQVDGSHVYSAKWLLVTTRQMAEENPEYCQHLLEAYVEAIRLIQSDTDNVMQMYSEQANTDEMPLIKYQPALHQLNLNWSLIAELHQSIQWAKLRGLAETDIQTDVISWFAPEPLRTIQPFSVKIPTMQIDESQP
ncbi:MULTISPECIES: ABC transporter substrate-binding protein [unclassified Methylophaga]|uniref:ABC transporter substrate-binding protein n=3 Tax=Methylophaga TaxID=40222 RepID=UPI0025D7F047|nr:MULTISPECIES: NrtA/SsuA/CpmA family ABC transporter substrate-binding protein [unclassified Methylophaga]